MRKTAHVVQRRSEGVYPGCEEVFTTTLAVGEQRTELITLKGEVTADERRWGVWCLPAFLRQVSGRQTQTQIAAESSHVHPPIFVDRSLGVTARVLLTEHKPSWQLSLRSWLQAPAFQRYDLFFFPVS
jgi:hypothetical protein